MCNKIKMAIASLVVALVSIFGLSVGAVPAQAATFANCADNTFCLYDNLNYGPSSFGPWHTSYHNILLHSDGGLSGCQNIGTATYANGDPVADNSASLVSNGATGTYAGYYWEIFNWANCNTVGGDTGAEASSLYTWPDLRGRQYGVDSQGNPIYEYHTITSVRVCVPTVC